MRALYGMPARLDPRRERLGDFARRPHWRLLERLDGAGMIDVNDGVELLCEVGVKVVALPLRLRPIDDADRAFEQRTVRSCANGAIVEFQQEPRNADAVEELFVASRKSWADGFALDRRAPVRRRTYGSAVRGETDASQC